MGCALRFGLLGPPVLYDACGTRDAHDTCGAPDVRAVGSPKVRALLAALLLEAGRVVPVGSLKDTLWGGAPPASAQASLHNHVTRLRRLLDDPERLRATPPGYLLRVDEGELDVHVFERHLAVARGAHAARDWELVVRECLSALALWRGAPLSGLPSEVGGYAFVQRLREARLLLEDWRYDAELAVGGSRLGALVPELAALAAEHPLRESYHRQLMLALHRTGRRAEALAVHRDLRSRLVGELGVEPGPGVREAHVEVLRGTPGTPGTPTAPARPGVPARPAVPAAPAMPTVPAVPVGPAAPAGVATPAAPAGAAMPAVPATPVAPDAFAVPAAPAALATPAGVAASVAPAVPAASAVPAAPRVPGGSAASSAPDARGVSGAPAVRSGPGRSGPAVPGEADTPPPHT
ncbi:AfsR/SARP family transcriptional regulator, partial [Streptomyces adustus]